jgi:cytochrome c-type biogenesis protein CcmE
MRWKVVVALALVAGAVVLLVTSLPRFVTPYVGFAEARRTGGFVQVNGQILGRDYVDRPQEHYLTLRLRDRQGEVMTVIYRGVIPANLAQTTMVVAVGRCRDGRFEAERLLVKCPSKYQPEPERSRAGP